MKLSGSSTLSIVMDVCGSLRRSLTQLNASCLLTYFLFCVFGLGSWVAINGIWGELSILVVSLPECYDLPAVLSVVIQVANIGPIIYIVLKSILRRCSIKTMTIEISAVYVLVTIGLLSCILLSITWDKTAVIGREHSVALIVLTFCLALVDCTSTLVFIPFMKHFPARYISALYIGEGMSGVIPSAVALSQGFVNNSIVCEKTYPGISDLGINFSPNVYFMFLASLTILCGLAFSAIITLPGPRWQLIPSSVSIVTHEKSVVAPTNSDITTSAKESDDSEPEQEGQSWETPSENKRNEECFYTSFDQGNNSQSEDDGSPLISHGNTAKKCDESNTETLRLLPLCCGNVYLARLLCIAWNNILLLGCMFVLNFISNGSLPSISTYIFKPYGNTVYHTAINLGIMISPLATLLFVFLSNKSRTVVAVLTAIACFLGIYLLEMALLSPSPLLKSHLAGKILIVSFIRLQSPCVP